MSAVQLRNALLATLGLMIIGTGVVIYYASGFLQTEVTKSVHANIDAETVGQDVERLKNLASILQQNQTSVEKAAQIVADTKLYQYQNQIITDINSYAQKTGVEVTVYDFGATDKPAANAPKLPAIPGVKSISANLTLASPMPYDNYLKFIKAIEQNLTKMQISGVNLAPDPADKNNITNPGIVLTIYVK